jgi:SAM-dependent methyltransferase
MSPDDPTGGRPDDRVEAMPTASTGAQRSGPGSEFAGAEVYYAEYRPAYDARAIDYLADRFDLDGGSRVLDLGCGAGQITVPLAAHAGEAVGVDPNAAMLDHARERAATANQSNVQWVRGSDADLTDLAGPFRLVTIGRAFHRMDRERVLTRLPTLLDSGGGLALVGDAEWLTRGTRAWQDAVYEVVATHLDDPPERTGPVEYDEPYDDLLRRHGFAAVERATFASEREWTPDTVVGYLFSLSFCAPRHLADPAAFTAAVRERLAAFDPPLVEDVTVTVVSGRPGVA